MSNYLCQDLILEIFTRLPPKSLLRFRSLSKSLCRCISSPGFIRMHASRSPQKIRFKHLDLTIDENKHPRVFDTLHGEDELALCLCPKRGYIGITTKLSCRGIINDGSCNGIFCLWTANKELSLWNPSIRRKLLLPECLQRYEPQLQGIGFGFDPVSDDFKIVMISSTRDTSFVYAVKMGAWCEIASVKPKFTSVKFFDAYLFNGVLHWEVCYPIKSQETSYILTFDLSTHVFGMIPFPVPTWHFHWKPTTIQGSLALFSFGKNVDHSWNVDDSWIWVWRDASWSRVFKLNFTVPNLVTKALQLQGTTNNGDLLLQMGLGDNLQVYNPTTGVRSIVVDFDADSSLMNFRPCVETLHLIDMGESTACETEQL